MIDSLRVTLCRVVTVAALLNVTAPLAADPPLVTPARLVAGNTALEAAADWLTYGGSYANWRYSPLADITRDNVARLAPAWMFQTGVQGQVAEIGRAHV